MIGRTSGWLGAVAVSLFAGGCSDPPVDITPGDESSGTGPGATGGSTDVVGSDGPADATGTSATGDATSATATDGGATGTGEPACALPAGVNAVLDGGAVQSLVPVAAPDVEAVAFRRSGTTITAVSFVGDELWSAEVGEGAATGGFDFDADGWPDFAIAHHVEGPVSCGAQTVGSSWLSLWHGVDGTLAEDLPPSDDLCWTFGATTYPTVQWTNGTILFGPDTSTLLTSATYAASSSFIAWDGGAFVAEPLAYPSTSAYDNTYDADLPNAWGTGTSFLANSHIANGLMAQVRGESRVVFFTSGRAVQYADAPLSASQLRADRPYLTGNRTDIAGRNYGLVTVDPQVPERVALLSGTTAFSVYADMLAGAMTFDPWGQIERHVSVYDTATNTVADRFYSYAHDNGDGDQYEGRVAYPDSPWVVTGPGRPSRLAYSVYEGGHWILHVSTAGGVDDTLALQGLLLWDIRDLDGDGIDEWVISPAELPRDPNVPGYYYTHWRTDLYHWDEAALQLVSLATFDDAIPELAPAFPTPTRRSSMSALYPTAMVADDDCTPQLVLRTSSGTLELVSVP